MARRTGVNDTIGHLSISRVPDRAVPDTKLRRLWAGHGLNADFVPPTRKPVDVFQAACRSVEGRRRNGNDIEVAVNQVVEDAATCVYQITRRVRNLADEVIEHEKAMRIRFDKASQRIDVDPLDPDTYDVLAGLEADVRDYYDDNGTKVPGQKIRNGLRAYYMDMGATNLINSAWFVPADDKGTNLKVLQNIQKVLDAVYPEGGAEIWAIPMPDDPTHRRMVAGHFNETVDDLVTKQIGKIADVLNNGNYVRKDLLRNVIQERARIGDLVAHHQDLLRDKLADSHSRLQVLDQQLGQLLKMKDETGGGDE